MSTTAAVAAWLGLNGIIGIAAMRTANRRQHRRTAEARARRQRTAGQIARHRARIEHADPVRASARMGEPFPLDALLDKWDAEDRGGQLLTELRIAGAASRAWAAAPNVAHPDFTNAEADFLWGTGREEPRGILHAVQPAFRCDELPLLTPPLLANEHYVPRGTLLGAT